MPDLLEYRRSMQTNLSHSLFDHGGQKKKILEAFGIIENKHDILDFSSNINHLGPPAGLLPILQKEISQIREYPLPTSELIDIIAHHHKCNREEIIIGNGSIDLIFQLTRLVRLADHFSSRHSVSEQTVICADLDFYGYREAAQAAHLNVKAIPLHHSGDWDLPKLQHYLMQQQDPDDTLNEHFIKFLVFLGHPHNPSGRLLSMNERELRKLCKNYETTLFIIDESFIDFAMSRKSFIDLSPIPENLVILRSLTKFYSIAGLRLGYLRAHHSLTNELRKQIPPWSINYLAEQAARYIFDNYEKQEARLERYRWRRKHYHWRRFIYQTLANAEIESIAKSQTNFLLIHWKNARKLFEKLLIHHQILIRIYDDQPDIFRIGLKSAQENAKLLSHLVAIKNNGHPIRKYQVNFQAKKRTPAFMVAGTSSDVGKSILLAALGRIFKEEGIRVAPFKAQNMSLESMITNEGLEMARMQAIQAQACRIDPDVRMNPILLKPTLDKNRQGSHVIVCGQSTGFYPILEYQKLKSKLFLTVKKQYQSLATDHEVILLEGAGSIAEINLKKNDLVNLRMAKYAEAKVLVIGDIERGGVFTSFAGTMAVLEHWERSLIYGFIINKFRGNPSLLNDAKEIVWQTCGRSLLGIIPFLNNLNLPAEDSLSLDYHVKKNRIDQKRMTKRNHRKIHIAVIRLDHIAQFSDFDALQIEPDVKLSFLNIQEIQNAEDLAVIFIPGSRNTQSDLKTMGSHGVKEYLARQIKKNKCTIWGICGGYQMMGRSIIDQEKIEGEREIEGFGWLDFTTTFHQRKILTKKKVYHSATKSQLSVYEIHHGQSSSPKNAQPIIFEQKMNSKTGLIFRHQNLPIYGGYLHGVFDNDQFRHYFLNHIRTNLGWSSIIQRPKYSIENKLTELADAVRHHINLKKIFADLHLS